MMSVSTVSVYATEVPAETYTIEQIADESTPSTQNNGEEKAVEETPVEEESSTPVESTDETSSVETAVEETSTESSQSPDTIEEPAVPAQQQTAEANSTSGLEEDEEEAAQPATQEESDESKSTDGQYIVWFDGTMGLSSNTSGKGNLDGVTWYKGATNVMYKTNEDGTITLPTSAGETTNYGYTLQGWYDITSGKYYKPGETVKLEKDSVFYADWFSTDYSQGSEEGSVEGQPDTSDFIETSVFDFNELFNLLSAKLNNVTITEEGHQEKWGMTKEDVSVDSNKDGETETESSLGFIFLNWAYNQITKITDNDSQESIGYMNGRDTNNENKSSLSQGIISSAGELTEKGKKILEAVFSKADGLGKKFLGMGNFLYQFVNDENDEYNGYYYYDSTKNGATYNQDGQRFYISKDTDTIIGQDIKAYNSGWMYFKNDGVNSSAFLPFNSGATQYNEKDGSINYWFGMKSDVQFWLPNNPGETDANKSTTGKDMEFKFSGDDDVWVLVDGQVVLDLGGIHGKKNGSINFSTGKVMTDGVETDLSELIGSGDHTLSIYYLERGSSQSNCSIYFNIAPRYSLSIDKADKETGEKLKNAEFSIYTDADCTEAAELWDSAKDCKDKKDSKNVFKTNADGTLSAYGLVAGHTYYVKETKSATGYEDVSDKVVKLTVKSDGTIEVEDVDGLTDSSSSDQGSRLFSINVTNTKKKTNISIEKYWNDSNNKDGIRKDSVVVKLYANGKDTGKTLTLSAANNWKASFEGLNQYDGEEQIVYTLEEIAVDGYTTEIAGDSVNGFKITNTHTPEEPDEPETPETPETPESPKTPQEETVKESETPKTITVSKTVENKEEAGSVQTDTETNESLWISLASVAALGCLVLMVLRKKAQLSK